MKRSVQIVVLLGIMMASFSLKDQDAALKKSMEAGKSTYSTVCVACHMNNGQGVPSVFPPLAKSDYLMEDVDRAIENLIKGLSGEVTVNKVKYNQVMPASALDDQEIADVLNYVMNSWGNKAKSTLTAAKVAKVRASLK